MSEDTENPRTDEKSDSDKPVDDGRAQDDSSAGWFSDQLVIDNVAVLNVVVEDHRSGGVYVSGGRVTTTNLAGRDSHDGDRREAGRERRIVAVTATSAGVRNYLRAVTVPGVDDARARDVLRRERLVILRGATGSGKRAAAVSLLDEHKTIFEVDPSLSLQALADFDEQVGKPGAHAYLVESLTPVTAKQLNGFTARRVGQLLAEIDSYLVLTVDDQVPLQGELAAWTVLWSGVTDLSAVLRRHLRYHLDAPGSVADDESIDGLMTRLTELGVERHLVQHGLGQCDRIAKRTAAAFHAGSDIAGAVVELGLDTHQQVVAWFSEDERSISDLAFLLAAAVLNGQTYPTVSRCAARLEELIGEVIRRDLFDRPLDVSPVRPRSERLATGMSTLERGFLDAEYGSSVAELVRMHSPELARSVLDVVWHEYDVLAEALMRWFHEEGCSESPLIRTQIAAAAGQFAQYDFATVRERLFLPWANDGRVDPRRMVTLALGVPAGQAETAGLVLGLLRHWGSIESNDAIRKSAVATYGASVGVLYPHVAVNELLSILTRRPAAMSAPVRVNLRSLFLIGAEQRTGVPALVLAALADWLRWESGSVRQVARDVTAGLLTTAADPSHWQSTAVWRQFAADESFGHSVALIAACLADHNLRSDVMEALYQLLALAADDELLYRDVERLVLGLLAVEPTPGIRPRERMTHYIQRWTTRPDAPAGVHRLWSRLQERETA